MRSFAVAALSLFALTVSAAPSIEARGNQCMTTSQAWKVANNFKDLISDYSNATANAVLCTSYTDYSDSVNELINNGCPTGAKPLGSATFTGRTAFEAGQGSQPNIEFDILNVWHNCNTVTLRWKSPNPGSLITGTVEQVTGIVVLETVYQGGWSQPWLIETSYSEFNSGAWLYDLGLFVPTGCNATS